MRNTPLSGHVLDLRQASVRGESEFCWLTTIELHLFLVFSDGKYQ